MDKKQLSVYCPDLELYHIKCRPVSLDDSKSTPYIHLCQLAHDLTRTNVENKNTSAMRSDGTALLMLLFEMGVVLSISRKSNQKKV